MTAVILALNSGSSSVKFQVLPADRDAAALMSGIADRIGVGMGRVTTRALGQGERARAVELADHAAALREIAADLAAMPGDAQVVAVAHRIVHGGDVYAEPVLIGAPEEAALERLVPLAPLHLPGGIEGIRAARALFPEARQVGCFDTAFHAGKPRLNDLFALPRRFYDEGLRRYGFHGLSCQSILRCLAEEGGGSVPERLVIAHLGNGCSVTAVMAGQSHGSSMGFSTLDGLAMGTRCGRIDPGALLYLLRQGMSVEDLETLLYRQSGLLGLSGLSSDMRDLEASDGDAAKEAIAYFVSACRQEIARAAAMMGGVDTVVFCGGIGENAVALRDRIVAGLGFLRSASGAPVDFRVLRTDEERELAIAARGFLG